METLRPLPVVDDRDTDGFFAAARRHELAIRMCSECGAVLHMPVAYCRHCGGWETKWETVSGRGRLYSWTVVEHQVHPAFPAPYTLVLVELEDHPEARLVGAITGRPDLCAGQPMEVWFEAVAEDVVLPQWRPVQDAETAAATHGT